jgi:hypothetical protein
MLLEEFNNIESNNSVYDVTNTTDHHKYLIYKGEFDPWRAKTSGRWMEGERTARCVRSARTRAYMIPKSPEVQSRKADVGQSGCPY